MTRVRFDAYTSKHLSASRAVRDRQPERRELRQDKGRDVRGPFSYEMSADHGYLARCAWRDRDVRSLANPGEQSCSCTSRQNFP